MSSQYNAVINPEISDYGTTFTREVSLLNLNIFFTYHLYIVLYYYIFSRHILFFLNTAVKVIEETEAFSDRSRSEISTCRSNCQSSHLYSITIINVLLFTNNIY